MLKKSASGCVVSPLKQRRFSASKPRTGLRKEVYVCVCNFKLVMFQLSWKRQMSRPPTGLRQWQLQWQSWWWGQWWHHNLDKPLRWPAFGGGRGLKTSKRILCCGIWEPRRVFSWLVKVILGKIKFGLCVWHLGGGDGGGGCIAPTQPLGWTTQSEACSSG